MCVRILSLLVFSCCFIFGQAEEDKRNDVDKNHSKSGYTEALLDFNVISEESAFGENNTEKILKKSIFIDNWRAVLNESSDFPLNRRFSYTKKVEVNVDNLSKRLDKEVRKNIKENVLGLRVLFPNNRNRGFVDIMPKYTVNPLIYKQKYTDKEKERGYLKNVGILKNIDVFIKGKNYPINLYIVLQDSVKGEIKIKMGSLNFNGWRKLSWKNNSYIQNIEDRVDAKEYPLYPVKIPYLMFKKFVFEREFAPRSGSVVTDFICYISKINVTYDKAIIFPEDEGRKDDITDEDVWGVYKNKVASVEDDFKQSYNKLEEIERLEKNKMNVNKGNDGYSQSNDDSSSKSSPNTNQTESMNTKNELKVNKKNGQTSELNQEKTGNIKQGGADKSIKDRKGTEGDPSF